MTRVVRRRQSDERKVLRHPTLKEHEMANPIPSNSSQNSGLVRARTRINGARNRGATPSDGGGTGRTDGND